jgi:hypothetical protein
MNPGDGDRRGAGVDRLGAVASVDAARRSALHSLERERLAADVIRALRQRGVTSLMLKGGSFALWLYGPGAVRLAGDVDLLVSPADVALAEEVLACLGFRRLPLSDLPADRPWHSHEWFQPWTGAIVDLHRTLLGANCDPGTLWSELSARAVPMPFGGCQVQVLDTTGRAVHVAMHAAQNGPFGANDDRSLGDLRRAIQVVDRPCWDDALALATRLGAREAMSAGLRLVPEGAQLADELGLTPPVSLEIRLRAKGAGPEALAIAWFLQLHGRARVRWVLSKLFPPPSFQRAWNPMAQRGRSGIVLAYAQRVVWLARRSPGALAAVFREGRSP